MTTPIPTPEVTPGSVQPVETSTPQGTTRQALYAQYYGAPTPEPEPTTDPVPLETSTASTEGSVDISALQTTINQLKQEVEGLRKASTPAPTPAPAPAAPVEEDWIEALKSGDWDKARKLVREDAIREFRKQQEVESPRERELSVSAAVERVRLENDLKEFVAGIRQNNTDLEEFTPYISARVDAIMNAFQTANPQVTTAGFVAEYKKTVLNEVESARKLVQKVRGSGVDAARTTAQTVVSGASIAPSTRAEVVKPVAEVPSTPGDYMKQRMEALSRRKGLVNN